MRIEWWNILLQAAHDTLEAPPYAQHNQGDLFGPGVVNQTRIGLDGHVQLLQRGRVQLSALSPEVGADGERRIVPGRRGAGPFDGWIVDKTTGFSIAWRGLDTPVDCVTAWPTVQFPEGGYRVTFNPRGITAVGLLKDGEVVLRGLPSKSLPRRLRRARWAGARDWGRGRLLLYIDPEGAVWPPRERNRNKRGRPPTQAWSEPVVRQHYW